MDYRDPIYGFVTVSDLEQEIIDTKPFQRLRRVLQLGPTNLVYPTANHTRFEHSLGTLQASSELLKHLLDDPEGPKVLGWDADDRSEAHTLLRLAALLHDVGHPPFSHATEDLFAEGTNHESYSYSLITADEIARLIDRRLGDGTSLRVAEIAVGQAKSVMDSFLAELLTGEIGTDRIDYLKRDSYHLGVAYGQFDRHRLLNTLFVRHNPDKDGPELALEDGGLHAVEGFLLARYFMFLDVYFHKTRRILDIHLTEFLRSWLKDGTFSTGLEEFVDLSDVTLLAALAESDNKASRRILSREFFRQAFETVDHPLPEELVAFRWLVSDVEAEFGPDDVRVDEAEKAPYSYAEPPLFVRSATGFNSLTERSSLVSNLRTIQKKRIYAAEPAREAVQEYCLGKWREILDGIGT